MNSVKFSFIFILLMFATQLKANSTDSNWINPWETFESAYPKNLSLIRRISIEESWDRAFEELHKYALLHKDWTFENDQILFEKIQLILTKNSKEITIEQVPQLKLYFQNRIKYYSTIHPELIIKSYNTYLDFFPKDKLIIPLFQDSFLKLNPKTSFNSDGELNLLIYNIHELINQNKEIPMIYFMILFNSCQTFNEPSKSKAEALLLLLDLFKLKEELLSLISLPEWDFLLVKRSELFRNFRKNKLTDLINSQLKIKAENDLYLHSIIIKNKLWDYQNNQLKLNWNSEEIQKYVAHVTIDLKNQFKDSSQKETYQLLFSQIEILRTLLELRTSLDSQTTPIISKGKWDNTKYKSNSEAKWYQKLKEFHNQAIGILQLTQYTTSLIFQCFEQSLDTQTCQSFRKAIPFQHSDIIPKQFTNISAIPSIKNPKNLMTTHSNNTNWYLNKPYIYFPPGRYEFDSNANIFIKSEKIEFHPLAFIYAPSGSINIESLEIDSPWIDVSAKEEVLIPQSMSPGKRPWIKNANYCHTRQYIEGASLISILRKSCLNKITSESCNNKPEWTMFTIKNPYPNLPVCASSALEQSKNTVGDISKMLDLGEAPVEPSINDQISPSNGLSAGTISIIIQEQFTSPLLIAEGANGSPGANGQSSPLCNNNNDFNSYKIVISQSETEYNQWIEDTKFNPYIKITSIQNTNSHHVGLLEILLPRTSATDGGSGGEGGQINLNIPLKYTKEPLKIKSYFISGGIQGRGGKAGTCGPNTVSNGKTGLNGADGKFTINKNNISFHTDPPKNH